MTASITPLRPGAQHTLLVADGDPVARCLVCDRLREEGYRVLESHSASEATAVLTSLPVHLLLLDVSIEAGAGRPSLVRLAAGLRPPPVVIMTGMREALSGALSRVEGLADTILIEKPCALPDLLAIIRNRLGPTAQS